MDADRLEGLRQQLQDLGLGPAEIEHQLSIAVAEFARPETDSDRMTVALQRKDVFAG